MQKIWKIKVRKSLRKENKEIENGEKGKIKKNQCRRHKGQLIGDREKGRRK